MKLLLDTCVWGGATKTLEASGHDVVWSGDWSEDPGDEEILAKAHSGLDVVKIDTDERIFPVEVSCSHCNHSLMHPETIIDGYPAIRVTVAFDNKHGWLALSCLYGSHKVVSLHDIPPGTILNIFCPHCHAELIGGAKCGACGAPMVPMIVRGGGIVQICARRGCKEHILDVGGSTLE